MRRGELASPCSDWFVSSHCRSIPVALDVLPYGAAAEAQLRVKAQVER